MSQQEQHPQRINLEVLQQERDFYGRMKERHERFVQNRRERFNSIPAPVDPTERDLLKDVEDARLAFGTYRLEQISAKFESLERQVGDEALIVEAAAFEKAGEDFAQLDSLRKNIDTLERRGALERHPELIGVLAYHEQRAAEYETRRQSPAILRGLDLLRQRRIEAQLQTEQAPFVGEPQPEGAISPDINVPLLVAPEISEQLPASPTRIEDLLDVDDDALLLEEDDEEPELLFDDEEDEPNDEKLRALKITKEVPEIGKPEVLATADEEEVNRSAEGLEAAVSHNMPVVTVEPEQNPQFPQTELRLDENGNYVLLNGEVIKREELTPKVEDLLREMLRGGGVKLDPSKLAERVYHDDSDIKHLSPTQLKPRLVKHLERLKIILASHQAGIFNPLSEDRAARRRGESGTWTLVYNNLPEGSTATAETMVRFSPALEVAAPLIEDKPVSSDVVPTIVPPELITREISTVEALASTPFLGRSVLTTEEPVVQMVEASSEKISFPTGLELDAKTMAPVPRKILEFVLTQGGVDIDVSILAKAIWPDDAKLWELPENKRKITIKNRLSYQLFMINSNYLRQHGMEILRSGDTFSLFDLKGNPVSTGAKIKQAFEAQSTLAEASIITGEPDVTPQELFSARGPELSPDELSLSGDNVGPALKVKESKGSEDAGSESQQGWIFKDPFTGEELSYQGELRHKLLFGVIDSQENVILGVDEVEFADQSSLAVDMFGVDTPENRQKVLDQVSDLNRNFFVGTGQELAWIDALPLQKVIWRRTNQDQLPPATLSQLPELRPVTPKEPEATSDFTQESSTANPVVSTEGDQDVTQSEEARKDALRQRYVEILSDDKISGLGGLLISTELGQNVSLLGFAEMLGLKEPEVAFEKLIQELTALGERMVEARQEPQLISDNDILVWKLLAEKFQNKKTSPERLTRAAVRMFEAWKESELSV